MGYRYSNAWYLATASTKLRQPAMTRVAFALSALVEASFDTQSLIIFYGTLNGVGQQLVTFAIGFTALLQGILEAAIAYLSDNLRIDLGRRHPLMAAAVLPSFFAMGYLYNPPEDSERPFSHLFFWLLVVRASMSLFTVPCDAMPNELTLPSTQ